MEAIKVTVDVRGIWDDMERLMVIRSIAAGLETQAAAGAVPRDVVYDAANRIRFVAGMSSEFLMLNLHQILNGTSVGR